MQPLDWYHFLVDHWTMVQVVGHRKSFFPVLPISETDEWESMAASFATQLLLSWIGANHRHSHSHHSQTNHSHFQTNHSHFQANGRGSKTTSRTISPEEPSLLHIAHVQMTQEASGFERKPFWSGSAKRYPGHDRRMRNGSLVTWIGLVQTEWSHVHSWWSNVHFDPSFGQGQERSSGHGQSTAIWRSEAQEFSRSLLTEDFPPFLLIQSIEGHLVPLGLTTF